MTIAAQTFDAAAPLPFARQGGAGAYADPGVASSLDLADERKYLVAYTPLVRRIVRQLKSQVGGIMDREDMEQIGLIGLLEALRRYGAPDEGFGAFAALRVRGAVLDELRRQDWRPRTVRQASHKVRDGVRALRRNLGHEPSEAEVLAGLKISAETYHAYQQDECAEELASFDELLQELSNQPSEHGNPESQLMIRRSLQQALASLDEREQRVIQLYYEYELNLKEIGRVLDLTEARVSQLNKGALRKMREFLQQP
jgi:RNA polymerase sigma factor for flagellar operon FliA